MPFVLWKKKAEPTVDRQRQVDVGYAVRRLEQGDLSLVAGCRIRRSVVFIMHNISLMEPRRSQAVEGGIRCRIARGQYFQVAQPKASEPPEELAEADRGMISISVDGLAFTGKSRRIKLGFGAIESMCYTQNGIEIVTKNGSQRLHFEGADRIAIPLKVQDRTYSQPLTGKLMRLLVEAVIRISFGVAE